MTHINPLSVAPLNGTLQFVAHPVVNNPFSFFICSASVIYRPDHDFILYKVSKKYFPLENEMYGRNMAPIVKTAALLRKS